VGSLDTPECLALILRGVAGPSAPGWARRLLAQFGSLPELLAAPLPDLQRCAPDRLALQIALVLDLHCRTLAASLRRRPVLAGSAAVLDYLQVAMGTEPREQFRVLFLDRRHRLVADEVLGRGSVHHAPVYPREVVRRPWNSTLPGW
jgi:DNA repair protein RadC